MKGQGERIDNVSAAASNATAHRRRVESRFQYLVGFTAPEARNDATGHVTDALTWVKGAHQIRRGGEYRRFDLNLAYFAGERGTFTFSGSEGPWATAPTASDQTADPNALILADFLAGDLYSGSITRGNQQRQILLNTYSAFGRDMWQVAKNLTANYGVRYDHEGALYNDDKNLSIFDPSKGGLTFQGNGIDSIYPAPHTNFSPRDKIPYILMSVLSFLETSKNPIT